MSLRRAAALGASLTAGFATAVLSAGCGSSSPGAGNPNASQLTVYSGLPLAGGANAWAVSMVNAEKLALKQVRGTVNHFRIYFYSQDDTAPATGRWDPGATSAAARMAAADHSTIAYIGDFDSGATAVSLPLLNGSLVPQVSPAAAYPGLTRAAFGGKGEPDRYYPSGRHTFFRLVPGDDVQASALLHYMRRENRTRAYLISDGDVFDSTVTQALEQLGPGHGLHVTGTDQIGTGGADTHTVAGHVASSGARAVVVSAPPSAGTADLITALARAAPHAEIFLPYATTSPQLLNGLPASVARRLRVTTPAPPVSSYTGAARDFAAQYHAEFGAEPDPWAIYGYESMRLILDAIRYAGRNGADHTAVVTQLLATQGRYSVLGSYSFDGNGDTTLRHYGGERVGPGGRPVFDGWLDTTPL